MCLNSANVRAQTSMTFMRYVQRVSYRANSSAEKEALKRTGFTFMLSGELCLSATSKGSASFQQIEVTVRCGTF